MIEYKGKKVTAKVYAKHKASDHMMNLFDEPEQYMDEGFTKATYKEQEEILKHISLYEDRIQKLLGVKFKSITSKSNYVKSI
jgi:hypothetical protein